MWVQLSTIEMKTRLSNFINTCITRQIEIINKTDNYEKIKEMQRFKMTFTEQKKNIYSYCLNMRVFRATIIFLIYKNCKIQQTL